MALRGLAVRKVVVIFRRPYLDLLLLVGNVSIKKVSFPTCSFRALKRRWLSIAFIYPLLLLN